MMNPNRNSDWPEKHWGLVPKDIKNKRKKEKAGKHAREDLNWSRRRGKERRNDDYDD